MDKTRFCHPITLTPSNRELNSMFAQEPLKTAENRLKNSVWFKRAVQNCMQQYASELALVGGYLEFGIPKFDFDEFMEISINKIRSDTLHVAFDEFIKSGAKIREVASSQLDDKDFVMEKMEELSEKLREHARGVTAEMLEQDDIKVYVD